MPLTMPLPQSLWTKAEDNKHPGLALDKYVLSWDGGAEDGNFQEKIQKKTLEKVLSLSRQGGEKHFFEHLITRRKEMLSALGAMAFTGKTAGPMTLHLSRASSLENAGICLHPLYGFAYIPGSGLKGLARAYAETLWRESRPGEEKQASEKAIREIFGASADGARMAGEVIFHDAWPESWPALELDIVNNHHGKYYDGKDDPGDCEDPVPVYFLSIKAGAVFSFALSGRRPGIDPTLLSLAGDWLKGGLKFLGAGAKTNAGYGTIICGDVDQITVSSPLRPACDVEVELVTPAFLAGASQDQNDCILRPATLRGLLRWWWRTMHAGHLDRRNLLRLESAIWGDTKAGGAVRVSLRPLSTALPEKFSYRDSRDRFNIQDAFKKANGLRDFPGHGTPGLFYLSYGMNDSRERPPRFYIGPGARWTIRFDARKADWQGKLSIKPDQVLSEARAALWLLCNYGGVGSKSRKGFGSLHVRSDLRIDGIQQIRSQARHLRESLGLQGRDHVQDTKSPSIDDGRMIQDVLTTPWTNYWYALNELGIAYQIFAQKYKHKKDKLALGLPRKIHGPQRTPMRHQNAGRHQPPTLLKGRDGITRHASPVHIHFRRKSDQTLELVVTAFPSAVLPSFVESQIFLRNFIKEIFEAIAASARKPGEGMRQTPSPRQPTSASGQRQDLPKHGEKVEAVLLEEKTKKNKWKARHEGSGLSGPIINSESVPPDKKAGDRISLIVHSVSASSKTIDFRIP